MTARRAWVWWLLLACGVLRGQGVIEVRSAEEGTPLPFATVRIGGRGGSADAAGRYQLPDGTAGADTLHVTFIGYVDRYVTLAEAAADGYVVTLRPVPLTDVVVVGRKDERLDRVTAAVEIATGESIERVQARTTTDALAQLTGAYVQQSQFGGGSPILRGLEANRVLLVVDGVRMNNAIYRSGHLQNAITVDPLALSRMEVIYGAGSLAYGSDALGGVVHFRTREPRFFGSPGDPWQEENDRGEVSVIASSAARSFQVGGRVEYGGENWAALTVLSTLETGDLRVGANAPAGLERFGRRPSYVVRRNGGDTIVRSDDPLRQVPTAYRQHNLLQKFRWRVADALELSVNLQASTTGNVPRYDALLESTDGAPRWAEWNYGPQTRLLGALRLDDRRGTGIYDRVTYQASRQFIGEDRIQRRYRSDRREFSLVDVHVTNLQWDFVKELPATTLRYGADLRSDRVANTAYSESIVGEADRTALPPRYPGGGSRLSTVGAYVDADRALHARLRMRGGLRVNRQWLKARFEDTPDIAWPAEYLTGITNATTAVTGSLGLRYSTGRHRLRGLVAQGFRAPNIDDFAKFRESNGFIEVPNPDLEAERSTTLEAGYEVRAAEGRLSAGVTGYHTWLGQAIIRAAGTLPGGGTTLPVGGELLRVQTNVNAERARILGGDFYLRWAFDRRWELSSDLHALRGRRRQLAPDGRVLTLPQGHIPPPYGSTVLRFRSGDWDLSASLRYQLAKTPTDYAVGAITVAAPGRYDLDRTGTSDNLELTAIDGTTGNFRGSSGWTTFNVYAEYDLGSAATVRAKVENVFDRHYRTFSSGVSAAGRDYGLSLTWKF